MVGMADGLNGGGRPDPRSVSRRGGELYEARVRAEVEPAHLGRFLALDVLSGDYEVGDEVLAVAARLRERRPGAEVYLMRVGRRAAFRLGGRAPARASSS
jgi:hypothetical protein